MTLARKSCGFTVHCDDCPDAIEPSETEFKPMLEEIRAEGWRTVKVGDGWQHFCPDCVDNWAAEQRELDGFDD